MDTYQQRKLEAALITHGVATSWRQFLLEAKRQGRRSALTIATVHRLGIVIDARTLQRWTRQAAQETSHKRQTAKA
jgi:hypothetical protein